MIKSGRASKIGAALKMVAIPVALLASGALFLGSSQAVFSASSPNTGNSWKSATLGLTNDHATALFTASSAMRPLDSEAHCITLTSTADVPTSLKLYSTAVSSTKNMADYLTTAIEVGTGGVESGGTCTGFTPTSTAFTGSLSDLALKADYTTGIDTGASFAPGASRQFRITTTLHASTPNTVQGGTATATYNWEIQ